MSLISLFTRNNPTIGAVSFDATLSTSSDFSTQLTTYAVESGVNVFDHRIFQPTVVTMQVALSNNKLTTQLTDFMGALTNGSNSGILTQVAGLSAGWLGGSDATSPSAALIFMVQVMQTSTPFSVSDGQITYGNMLIRRITRERNPENENSIILNVEMQEIITRDRLRTNGKQPLTTQLSEDDVSSTSISALVRRGRVAVKEAAHSVTTAFNSTGLIDL